MFQPSSQLFLLLQLTIDFSSSISSEVICYYEGKHIAHASIYKATVSSSTHSYMESPVRTQVMALARQDNSGRNSLYHSSSAFQGCNSSSLPVDE